MLLNTPAVRYEQVSNHPRCLDADGATPQFATVNFGEFLEREVRRISIPRTPVNKGKRKGRGLEKLIASHPFSSTSKFLGNLGRSKYWSNAYKREFGRYAEDAESP